MAETPEDPQTSPREPRGFGEHTRRTSSENAHEQGWGLNEEERRRVPAEIQKRGGTDYDYGAQDFGDSPVDTSTAQAPNGTPARPGRSEERNTRGEVEQRRKTA